MSLGLPELLEQVEGALQRQHLAQCSSLAPWALQEQSLAPVGLCALAAAQLHWRRQEVSLLLLEAAGQALARLCCSLAEMPLAPGVERCALLEGPLQALHLLALHPLEEVFA